jgi:hypothetical protein
MRLLADAFEGSDVVGCKINYLSWKDDVMEKETLLSEPIRSDDNQNITRSIDPRSG